MARDPADLVMITLVCGCRVGSYLKPMWAASKYMCRSNQGHSYNQPWVSYVHRGLVIPNKSLLGSV